MIKSISSKSMNIKKTVALTVYLMLCNYLIAQVNIFSSNKEYQWKTETLEWSNTKKQIEADIIVNEENTYQTIDGWGGCFNERGWKALQYLTGEKQKEIMTKLFSDNGCAFSYCRMPIGASDYALDYYSLNDTHGDYKMNHFSIDRDRKYLFPYIKAAIQINPELKVWGSPWTPPAWMKENNSYNKGLIKMDPQILEAYALYFQKYVEAYRNEGVNIVAVHPQNEPLHLPAFPSCGWSGQNLKTFIKDYLGPRFKKHVPNCEIWLGTINGNKETDEFSEYIQPIFGDPEVAKYITGAGFQWDGDSAVERTNKEFPNKKIMQTETKCGWGTNDWKYAFETYNQMVWYLERNASYYLQWNMVLNETGMSSWGWKQNTMITVDTFNKTYQINPQYWAVRHFTQFVKPQAKRVSCKTKDGIQSLAFKNPNGNIVLILSNQGNKEQNVTIQVKKESVSLKLLTGTIYSALIK